MNVPEPVKDDDQIPFDIPGTTYFDPDQNPFGDNAVAPPFWSVIELTLIGLGVFWVAASIWFDMSLLDVLKALKYFFLEW